MNPLIREAAAAVHMGWLLGAMTVVFFVFFLGLIWWVWSPSSRQLMEEAAQMPFTEGGDA